MVSNSRCEKDFHFIVCDGSACHRYDSWDTVSFPCIKNQADLSSESVAHYIVHSAGRNIGATGKAAKHDGLDVSTPELSLHRARFFVTLFIPNTEALAFIGI